MIMADIREDLSFSLRHPQGRFSIIVFAISMLLVLFVGLAYWWPITHTASSLKIEIEDRQREIASAEYNLKLAQASADAAQQMELIEKKLDASVTQADLVQNIASLARRNKVKIVSVAYEEGKVKDGFSPLVHVLTVQAGYPELRGFIVGLQQLPTFTIAQEAVLSRSANSFVIKAQLNIITYRRIVVPML
jgi:hypothetical protein